MKKIRFRRQSRLKKYFKKFLDAMGWGFVYRSPEKKECDDEQLWEIYKKKSKRELAKIAKCSHTNAKVTIIRKILNS
tara:strand:+ start:14318 stop:14548 length:231 start_codon:yes stop_codon:yes gene_type:complete